MNAPGEDHIGARTPSIITELDTFLQTLRGAGERPRVIRATSPDGWLFVAELDGTGGVRMYSEIEEAILKCFADVGEDDFLRAPELAEMCGAKLTVHFRNVLANLVERCALTSCYRGYKLTPHPTHRLR